MGRWVSFLLRTFCISIFCGVCFGHDCYRNEDIDDSGPVIVTNSGAIVGKYVKFFEKEIPAFLGIPFAKPPVGDKRFKIAEPIEQWEGTLLAKEKSAACMQYSTRDSGWIPQRPLNFSEDCLYLNVWLPANCCCQKSGKLPVMAWIHGGGYYSGSAVMDIYDGGVLATLGEVIVVTFNYRLSVFGFLNLDSKDAPGNMGLHDQLLALQWVHENIQYFGGDPNSVTLFGESAGSLSVSLQMISPLSRNLFHKAILESGTAAQPFKVSDIEEAFNLASQYSEVVGCSNNSSDIHFIRNDVLKCFKNKSPEELVIADNYFTSKSPHFFTASYGNKCKDCLKYFSGSPTKSAQSGDFAQIPALIGNTKDEGTIFLTYTIPRIFKRDQRPLLTIPVAKRLLHDFFHNIKRVNISAEKVFDYYVENITGDSSNIPLHTLIMIYSDYVMKCGIMYFADQIEDAYFYIYAHRSHKDPDNEWMAVPHFSEIPYVFGDPIRNPVNYTFEDINFSEDIIQTWTTFAYNGYPFEDFESEWPKYSSFDRKVYELRPGRKDVLQNPSEKACDEFWRPYYME